MYVCFFFSLAPQGPNKYLCTHYANKGVAAAPSFPVPSKTKRQVSSHFASAKQMPVWQGEVAIHKLLLP